MTLEYDLNKSPLSPGENRELTWLGRGAISGEIRCFTKIPPPPGYKPCEACGSFLLQQSMSTIIHADHDVFEKNGGELEITLTDDSDYQETITLVVKRRNDGSSGRGQSGNSGSGGLERAIAQNQHIEQSMG